MNVPSLSRFGLPAWILVTSLAASLTVQADTDLGFIETFALASDREVKLQ